MDFSFELSGPAACLSTLAVLAVVILVVVLWLRRWMKGLQGWREKYDQFPAGDGGGSSEESAQPVSASRVEQAQKREGQVETSFATSEMRAGWDARSQEVAGPVHSVSKALKGTVGRLSAVPWGDLLGAPVLIALGGLVLFWGVRQLERSLASLNWPTTEGRVRFSTVDVRQQGSGIDESTSYVPRVGYEYRVKGELYQDTGITQTTGNRGYGREQAALEVAERYPAGSTVIVYYHPDQPEVALLEPGRIGNPIWMLGGGLLFMGAGGWIGVRAARKLST